MNIPALSARQMFRKSQSTALNVTDAQKTSTITVLYSTTASAREIIGPFST